MIVSKRSPTTLSVDFAYQNYWTHIRRKSARNRWHSRTENSLKIYKIEILKGLCDKVLFDLPFLNFILISFSSTYCFPTDYLIL